MPMCGQRTVKSRHSRVREMSMQNPNMRKAKSQAWQGWQPGNPSGRRERLFLAFRQAWKKRLSEGRCTERSRNGQARNPGNRNVYRGGRPDGRRRQGRERKREVPGEPGAWQIRMGKMQEEKI